jgi:hypothetical protein
MIIFIIFVINNLATMDLTTTPFDISILRKKCEFIEFTENKIKLVVLMPSNQFINSGHRYMFGAYKDGDYYWFFNGKSIAESRQMMRDIYFEITENISDKNQTIFTFKGNLYGNRI